MSDLYLIAHKVRGEPAFDVATQVECAVCVGSGNNSWDDGCHECDGLGFWWIIPTSGHRAYPWWNWPLENTELNGGCNKNLIELAGEMPPNLPDHYPTRTSAPALDISGLLAPAKVRIDRRF